MAIFHHSTQVIGRSSGRSSVGAAAYRLGVELVDQRTGQAFDYTRKAGVDSWHTIAPDNAPAWVNDAGELWNAVEAAEKRKDAQLCREVNVALPRELTPDQMKALALDYAREQWAARGMVAVVAFHDLDSANPHFHAMLTMREIGPDGFG
ncbi:TPA: MobA/MobL family protein, partial [Stenotrophomonas maltophilia]|nr:MobA/MobL family protein [Stenotrophomonas maltophilia]HEF1874356.1 MobA/MobL family protein [Stenotrophomonas maltophilia]HEF1894713.1 MobA/MobL family protein [Stenotrophomonas maltophilia]